MECHFNFLPPYITTLQYLDTGTLYGELVTHVYSSAYDGHLNKGQLWTTTEVSTIE